MTLALCAAAATSCDTSLYNFMELPTDPDPGTQDPLPGPAAGPVLPLPTAVKPDALFGYTVAINDRWAVVGAPRQDIGTTDSAGSVFVYKRSGSDGFEYVDPPLTGKSVQRGGCFGSSLALHGDIVLIGESSVCGIAVTPQVVAYDLKTIAPQPVPIPVAKAMGTGAQQGARFALALSAGPTDLGVKLALVGETQLGSGRGSMSAFTIDAVNMVAKAVPFDPPTDAMLDDSEYGFAVAAASDYAVMGAPRLHGDGGQVFGYRIDWTSGQPTLTYEKASQPGSGAMRLGEALALSPSPVTSRILIGAPGTAGPGAAVLLSALDEPFRPLKEGSSPPASQNLGKAVALSGAYALALARSPSTALGNALSFRGLGTTSYIARAPQQAMTPIGRTDAVAVAVHGRTVLFGVPCPEPSSGNTCTGMAYVMTLM